MKNEISIKPYDRVLVLAPHPDDEIIAAGGIIQKALEAKASLKVVFFTYGDNNEWSFLLYRNHPVIIPEAVRRMGGVRHDEACEAAAAIGNPLENLVFMGYPDFRTLEIWHSHWKDDPPAMSMFTRVNSVPYKSALSPGNPYKGEEIVRDLETVLRGFRPTQVFVSHAGDHNPDHVALYLFSLIALWNMEGEITPDLHPYLVHRRNWPLPQGLHEDEPLEGPVLFEQDVPWDTLSLKKSQVDMKRNAVMKHKSQYSYSSEYLLSFVRKNELFGDFSVIDLGKEKYPLPLVPNRREILHSTPGTLTSEEEALFLGVEEHSVRLGEDELFIDIMFSEPFGEETGASSYIFGYRRDTAFGDMPKVHVKYGAIEHRVFDRKIEMAPGSAKVERREKEITISVPLEVLGRPERVLINTRTYLGDVPLDYVPWRTVVLK